MGLLDQDHAFDSGYRYLRTYDLVHVLGAT
jgi:hypothetical protein